MRVFITGATGFIGQAIVSALRGRGDQVVALSRSQSGGDGIEWVTGDPTQAGRWQDKVAGCDAVIHLAGEPLAGRRWNAEHKRRIKESRVDGTREIVAALARAPRESRPRILINASGADIYPSDDSDRPYAEDAPAGASFLSEVCLAWEEAARAAEQHHVRVSLLRTAVVLGKGEGALAKMLTPFKLFLGGPVGSGNQWFSWVHIDDVVGATLFALDRVSVHGPLNVVSPGAVRQRDFAAALGRAVGRPSWMPVPATALRLAVGELADYLLGGRRAVPAALEHAGYAFKYPTLEAALATTL